MGRTLLSVEPLPSPQKPRVYPKAKAIGNLLYYMACVDILQETVMSIMKLLAISLVIAVVITLLLMVIDHSPGLHSTRGFGSLFLVYPA